MPNPQDYNLSEGALETILSGGDYPSAVMQVLGKKLIHSGAGDKERVRILLSDGKHTFSYAMLTTQVNGRLGPNGIEDNGIIRIEKYITSMVNNSTGQARVLLILEADLVVAGSEVKGKIGTPEPWTDKGTANSSSSRINGAPKKVETPSKVVDSPVISKPISKVSMDTSMNFDGSLIHPISSLTPYQNRWVIRARVTGKTPVKTWSNSRGEGKLFSFDLLDESGEIRCTAFRDLVDKFHDFLQVDKIYYISKGQLKMANKQFSTLKHEYEITINNDTQIQECKDVKDSDIPQVQYNFVPFDKIPELEVGTIIDAIGVVKSVGELITFQAKSTQRELKKKDVTLIDQSSTTIDLTLWGADAENFDAPNNPVVVVKGAKINEFGGGKSLSTLVSSNMSLNPEIKECYRLKGWYEREGGAVEAKNLSARSGNVASKWMTFKEVKDQKLGQSEKGDYYRTVGTILIIKAENFLYQACPSAECNKKVLDMGNGMYKCEKCNREYPNFKHRFLASINVGDNTANQWMTLFHPEIEKILGMTAEEVGQQIENKEEINNIIERATFRELIFTCRAKIETYNDEARLKTVCIRIEPIDYEEYNQYLVDQIQQLTG
ncbi:unnamed protein product [Phyllotreta striolata]|uniref:Replication protein A subunit n=1 Tax=Phyllotreta striolata TaxID=444603 RepID=A0A9N9TY36_PHYSR|nr:unnamed protein product [Phyllotreta striolata]